MTTFGRLVLPWVAFAIFACGRERPFADDNPQSGVDTLNPSATGIAGSGSADRGPSTASPDEGSSPSLSLDSPAVAGTGLCEADAGCQCNDDVQSCDPLPLCDGGVQCAAGTCAGCLIDGECLAADTANPSNPCQLCDPGRDPSDWSDADGAGCDDGAFCTEGDSCQTGECVGTPRVCDDGVACNGVATCDETTRACLPGQSQCGANALCDLASSSCVTTCNGCIISGTCLAMGDAEPGNPCRICDPPRSATAFSVAAGRTCGAPAGVCSAQDTCDALGACQPNHSAEGSACGNPGTSACDRPDTCDGSGNCLPRTIANSTPCSDDSFCTVGDACLGGACAPAGNRNCGSGLACNEGADQCQCQGCVVGGNCFAAGATNGNDPCQICDPARSTVSFSGNTGRICGSPVTECSAQDSCNAQGQCVANHVAFPTPCTSVPGGQCQGDGRCAAPAPTQVRLTT